MSDLYHALHAFKSAFSREKSRLLYCALTLSFLTASEMNSVTSLCRYWLSDEKGYLRVLHFFRAKSYNLETLHRCWHSWVLEQQRTAEAAERLVLLGDHTYVVKDGGRMPGVVSLRETSETQSKPSYFRGQCWGAVGILVGTFSDCFCLPLRLQIHQGFQHVRETEPALKLGERVAQMAVDFARHHDRLSDCRVK